MPACKRTYRQIRRSGDIGESGCVVAEAEGAFGTDVNSCAWIGFYIKNHKMTGPVMFGHEFGVSQGKADGYVASGIVGAHFAGTDYVAFETSVENRPFFIAYDKLVV